MGPIAYCLLASVVGGCASQGPSALRGERANYNVVLQKTTEEQLLLNLVRLKYRDTPFFLEVSSISSQFIFGLTAEASASVKRKAPDLYGFGASGSYEEKPTVTYSPVQGEEFVKRLLSPVKLETLMLLYHSGWSVERVLRLFSQRINGVKNAPSASGPTPTYVPKYKEFARACKILRRMQIAGELDLLYELKGEHQELSLKVASEASGSEHVRELRKLLKLAPGQASYPLTDDLALADPGSLRIQTRSLLGILFYLSQAVEAPELHRERGKVTITKYDTGELFDWREVTGDLLRIHSQSERPSDAAAAVRYRRTWFYIDDADLNSKSTFSLLGQIFALQAGRAESIKPVLTLGVGD